MNENKIIASLCIIGLLICSVVYFTQSKTSDIQEAADVNIQISIDVPEAAEVSSTQPIVKVEKEDEGFVGGGTSHWSGDIEAVNITATGDLTIQDDVAVTDEICYGGICYDSIEGTCASKVDGDTSTSSLFTVINPFDEDVYIPGSAVNQPIIGANAVCKTITIEVDNGAKVTINSSFRLDISN